MKLSQLPILIKELVQRLPLRRRCGLTQAIPMSNRYSGMETVSAVFKGFILIYTLKHVYLPQASQRQEKLSEGVLTRTGIIFVDVSVYMEEAAFIGWRSEPDSIQSTSSRIN